MIRMESNQTCWQPLGSCRFMVLRRQMIPFKRVLRYEKISVSFGNQMLETLYLENTCQVHRDMSTPLSAPAFSCSQSRVCRSFRTFIGGNHHPQHTPKVKFLPAHPQSEILITTPTVLFPIVQFGLFFLGLHRNLASHQSEHTEYSIWKLLLYLSLIFTKNSVITTMSDGQ